MSETIDDLAPIGWLRDLFEDASAESMYRWMIVAWIVAVGVLIGLDRVGWSLLGRSKPRSQTPPFLARLWRWRGRDAPAKYSLLPGKTVTFPGSEPRVPASIPLARSAPIEEAELVAMVEDDMVVDVAMPPPMLMAGPIPNDRYWRLSADPEGPVFGLENNVRLELGRAPERYNPITDRIETLERDATTGIASWPRTEGTTWHGLGIGLDEPPEGESTEDDPPEGESTEEQM